MRSHVLSAAKTRLYVNAKPFGRCTAFAFASETPRREIYGVDSMEAYELAPTTCRVSGAITVIRLEEDGGAEVAGLVAPYGLIPQERYFGLTLVDIVSDQVVFEALKCSLVSQHWEVASRGLVTGQLAFTAIDFSNGVNMTPGPVMDEEMKSWSPGQIAAGAWRF